MGKYCLRNISGLGLLVSGILSVSDASIAAAQRPSSDSPVITRLVVDRSEVQLGEPFNVGIHFRMTPHSHIYWRNPGESGFATGIEWELPEGFTMGPLQWPAPRKYYMEEIDDTSFGYEDEVLLFAEVTVPRYFEGPLQIQAKPYWLVCLDDGQCIPGDAALELTSGEDGVFPADYVAPEVFEAFLNELPMAVENAADIFRGIASTKTDLQILLQEPWEVHGGLPYFFPLEGDPWQVDADIDPTRPSVTLKGAREVPSGVLVLDLQRPQTEQVRRVGVFYPSTKGD